MNTYTITFEKGGTKEVKADCIRFGEKVVYFYITNEIVACCHIKNTVTKK